MKENKEINIKIGEQVRIARERAKMTQEELAETLDVSSQYISDLERGVVGLAVATLKRLCVVLKVSSDNILFGEINRDSVAIFSNICQSLNEEQFAILLEIAEKYVKAVNTH